MTVREIYVEMLNVLNDTERKFSNVELQEAIEGRIQKLDEQNAKRRAAERKPSASMTRRLRSVRTLSVSLPPSSLPRASMMPS